MSERFVLSGLNEVDRQERANELSSAYDPTGLATTRLDARDSSVSDVRQAVLSPPFFGGQRVVLIDNLFAVASAARLRDVSGRGAGALKWTDVRDDLLEAPESTVLIINGYWGPPGSTSGQLRRRGWTVEQFPELREAELAAWVSRRANTLGVEIDRDAVQELLGRMYPTLWQRAPSNYDEGFVDTRAILTEVEKLALAVANGRVSQDDVRQLVAERPGLTAFRLGDAVFSGQTKAALDELEQSLLSGEAPEKLLGQLAHQLSALQAARIASAHDLDAVAAASGFSPGLISVTLNRKQGWRYPEALQAAAEALRLAEWNVRTGRANGPEETIVPAVAEISEAFRVAAGRRGND